MQELKPDKKDLIINVAERLFAVKGFEGVSVRELCQEAGVNLAMVNYYFGSKEGLFEKLVIRKASFLQGKIQELLDDKTLEPIEKLDRIIENYVARLFAHRGFSLTILREMTMQQRENMHDMIADVFSNNLKLIRQVLLQGIKKKQFRKVDLELTVASMIGTIHNLLVHEPLVLRMLEEDKDFKPFQNEKFKKRVTKHIQEMMRSHLLIHQTNK